MHRNSNPTLNGKWAWACWRHPWRPACQRHYRYCQYSVRAGSVGPHQTYRPVDWPAALLAAVLAFSAFFTLWAAVRFSLPSLMAAWRAAERASGRCARRSLMTSREAPTMARWDLTWRRRRDLAASCGGCEHVMSFVDPVRSSSRGCVPQRYPFSSGDGTEQSMRSCGGSCAGGRETRTFRTGSGRSCCPSGRRACPVESVCQHECRS
jgi:hypothetical protein